MRKASLEKWVFIPSILLLLFTTMCYSFYFVPLPNAILTDTSQQDFWNNWRIRYGSKGWWSSPPLPQPASPEYLIIAPNTSWAQSFADWKTQKGVPTVVANTSWIYANIGGRDQAEQIWNYINQIYNATFPSPPTLKWLLLIGDNSTLPPRYTYHPETYEWPSLSQVLKPTDFYYSVMDDNDWDDDGDGFWGECFWLNNFNPAPTISDEISDWDPDLYVGRLPFSDEVNITTILDHTLQYAKNPGAFSATGWDSFLLAGAISNYEEELNNWNDPSYPDWTTEAELSDRIDDDLIPAYYNRFRFYEDHTLYFWDYTPTNYYQIMNVSAVQQGLNTFDPALVNLAGHGSPYDIQRKYDGDSYPYGGMFTLSSPGLNINVTGVAIGDPDNDGNNEIVATTGPRNSPTNGTIFFYDGTDFQTVSIIWDLWRQLDGQGLLAPIPGVTPCWATCIDIGDVWNNGTISVVVGTSSGAVVIFTFWNQIKWTAFTVVVEPTDPVLCIEVGNADNANAPPPYSGHTLFNLTQTDIAWGHRSGMVLEATVKGSPIPLVQMALIANMGQAIYSIDVGNPNDDILNEVTYGTGYLGITAMTGDCNMSQHIPGSGVFAHFAVDINVGGIVYGLDTGDAANDGFNKVVLGLSTGAIFMYEANLFSGGTDAGTKQIVTNHGANYGIVRCLRVGEVDNNDIASTIVIDDTSIIVGVALGGIRKYHADNYTGYIDEYPIQPYDFSGISRTVTAIDIGELSYTTSLTEVGSNLEVAAGTNFSMVALCFLNWYEWPWNVWDNFLNTTQVNALTTSIPALIYADSCLTGAFDYPKDSLADAFLYQGAIGYIGSMRVCWYYYGPMTHSFTWGGSRWLSYNYWDLFFGGTTNYRPGSTLFESKRLYNSTFWPIYSPSWVQYWEQWHRKNLLTIALFGDPEVDIYTDNPGTFYVTHSPGVPHNQNATILVHDAIGPVANALVCLWDPAGSYYERALTNSSGYVVFNITAPAMTVLDLTITKHNISPYLGNLAVSEWLTVSGPSLSYDSPNLLLNITGITAYCPVHGTINAINAIKHTYTIYQGSVNITSGALSWDSGSSTWQALNVPTLFLSENIYWVRAYFTDSDGIGWADSSTTFTVEHHITIYQPTIIYDDTAKLLDIIGVNAFCSYTPHGLLDDTEATIHTYTVFDSSDIATSITGNLTWDISATAEWRILNVDVSSLSAGTYYVRCTFADSDVAATQSPHSTNFIITAPPTTTPTTTPTPTIVPIIPGFPVMAILIGVILALSMILLVRHRKLRKQ